MGKNQNRWGKGFTCNFNNSSREILQFFYTDSRGNYIETNLKIKSLKEVPFVVASRPQ
jgi:hypothetical protein